MKKVIVSVGLAGLAAGLVLALRKRGTILDNNGIIDCPLEIVKEKAESLSDKIADAPVFQHSEPEPVADPERKEKLQEAHDAFTALLLAKQDDDVPENINYVEDVEHDERAFTLGTGEGELVQFSDEYKAVIYSAYKKSLKDKDFTLKFYGSTYGIGTKGKDSDDGGKVFSKDDIAKLKKKLEK